MSFYLPLIKAQFNTIEIGKTLTSLWSGCGSIVSCKLDQAPCVIKAIKVPKQLKHPKIKQTPFALQRKQKSYQVEYCFYKNYSAMLPQQAASIECIAALNQQDEYALVFKDFTALGYHQAQAEQIPEILHWLAHFHAFNLGNSPDGLWQQGNYWHLATRPDELANMANCAVKEQAAQIDKQLLAAQYQTIIHGDAKLTNFAYNHASNKVLAYDFQYTGKGAGIIDVMYFLGSVLNGSELEQHGDHYLSLYFSYLSDALSSYHLQVNPQLVVAEWRKLWPVAWADFYRFLAGWSPSHVKINSYMQKMTAQCLTNKTN